ncbi:MAG TPA: GAF domain-containing protein [Streptosporangiaceae bacterium]|jgi:DNA-binding response OmpR family regulator
MDATDLLTAELARAHDAALSGGPADGHEPRGLVADSWRRSLRACVDPDTAEAPAPYAASDVRAIRETHPLAALIPALRDQLDPVLATAPYVAVLTDAHGLVLWREGSAKARAMADSINLSEGTRWAEEAIGTNGIGTALAVGRPTSIFAAEHLVRRLHRWSCAGAPVRDPDTGGVLGCLDLSGSLRALHPAAVSLIAVSARLMEAHLRTRMAHRDEHLLIRNAAHLTRSDDARVALLAPSGRVVAATPSGWLTGPVDVTRTHGDVQLADGTIAVLEPLGDGYLLRVTGGPATAPVPSLTLAFLGRTTPIIRLNGREIPISLRRAEILTLLALHPAGLTAEQLTAHLYGHAASPVTVRAEVHRLRAQLGPEIIGRRPYRLAATVEADFTHVRHLLRTGDTPAATAAYLGPLLPASESPTVRAERDALHARLYRLAG